VAVEVLQELVGGKRAQDDDTPGEHAAAGVDHRVALLDGHLGGEGHVQEVLEILVVPP
jgi:hypothetical protein